MKYIATVDGQDFHIEIHGEDEITVNGEPYTIDFREVAGPSVVSLLHNNDSYEAYIYPAEQGMEVLLRGKRYHVGIEDERQRLLREISSSQSVQRGEFTLKAPMPGLIVAIHVDVDQQVSRGENLVVLESMKMQNELRSPRDGLVSSVRVSPGDNVDQDQVLLVLQ
jgi:biotin carboxyl carrier protein